MCYQIKSSFTITHLICYTNNFDVYFRELEMEQSAAVSALSAMMKSDPFLHIMFSSLEAI